MGLLRQALCTPTDVKPLHSALSGCPHEVIASVALEDEAIRLRILVANSSSTTHFPCSTHHNGSLSALCSGDCPVAKAVSRCAARTFLLPMMQLPLLAFSPGSTLLPVLQGTATAVSFSPPTNPSHLFLTFPSFFSIRQLASLLSSFPIALFALRSTSSALPHLFCVCQLALSRRSCYSSISASYLRGHGSSRCVPSRPSESWLRAASSNSRLLKPLAMGEFT